jgi:hypothetical protein
MAAYLSEIVRGHWLLSFGLHQKPVVEGLPKHECLGPETNAMTTFLISPHAEVC